MALPTWIKPQLTKLVDQPPEGPEWLHEIKFDGYRMHARLERGVVRLLTRTGLDWTPKYPAIAAALAKQKTRALVVERGLTPIDGDLARGTLIAFASDPKSSALDGPTGAHSPFTEAFLAHLFDGRSARRGSRRAVYAVSRSSPREGRSQRPASACRPRAS